MRLRDPVGLRPQLATIEARPGIMVSLIVLFAWSVRLFPVRRGVYGTAGVNMMRNRLIGPRVQSIDRFACIALN